MVKEEQNKLEKKTKFKKYVRKKAKIIIWQKHGNRQNERNDIEIEKS